MQYFFSLLCGRLQSFWGRKLPVDALFWGIIIEMQQMPGAPDNDPKPDNRQDSPPPASPIVRNDSAETTPENRSPKVSSRIHWPNVWEVIIGIAAFAGVSVIFYSIAHWAEE